jgi:hypothetical protein
LKQEEERGQKQQQHRQRQKVKSANLLSVVFFSGMSLGQPSVGD